MTSKDESHFDLGELFGIIWRRKWYVIIPTILSVIAAGAMTFILTPTYETSSIIWVGSSMRLSGDLERLIGNDLTALGQSRNRTEELRSLRNEIKSSPYIRQLVDQLELDKDPALKSKAAGLKNKWPHLTIDQIKFNILLEDLRDRILIEFSGSDQIKITAESHNPSEAQGIATTLSGIFINEKKRQQLGAVQASQNFSFEQLEKYEEDLQGKIRERTEFDKEYLKIQLDDAVISEDNRRDISAEIQSTKIEITDKEDEAREIMKNITAIPSNHLTLNDSSELNRLKREVRTLLASIANLMLRYRWNDPEILNFKSRLYNFMDQVEDENRRLVNNQFSENDGPTKQSLVSLFNIRAQLDMLYSRQNNLQLALNDLSSKINMMPEYQARLDQLDREVNAAREIRDRFQTQQETAQISQAVLSESEYKIIQPAQTPLNPVFPDNKKLIVIGLMFGLVVGGGLILLRELLDTTFKKVEDVEGYLHLPVVGVIPDIVSVKKTRLGK